MAVKVTPNSNTVNVALAKQAPIVAGGEMHFFLQSKMRALGGDPAKLVRLVRYGATTSFGRVVVASVPASHTNGLSPVFLEKEQAQALAAAGLTAYVGPAGGFVLRFSNGLTAYLSGDTGITAEQDVVVRRFHRASLAVMSVGGAPNMNGPQEAAYVMNELVQPSSIIITHVNEQATDGGKVRPGTKTDAFIKAVRAPVHVPLSGRTMEFDGTARCVTGC
jgi:L-ascorbate metabolism protein UlaG (beta-lactamase superfamily)